MVSRQLRNASCGLFLSLSLLLAPARSKAQEVPVFWTRDAPAKDYVPTPSGWAHKSCVHKADANATLEEHGREVVISEAGVVRRVSECVYPMIPSISGVGIAVTKSSEAAAMAGPSPPAANGWIEYAGATAANNRNRNYFTELRTNWQVPAAPRVTGALLYFFNGLKPNAQSLEIVQPVLQFGVGPAGGGNFWAMANWQVFGNQIQIVSGLQPVSVGDAITGRMTSNACTVEGVCNWQVQFNVNGGAWLQTIFVNSRSYTLALRGVLEAYNLSSCTMLPGQGTGNGLVFSGNYVYMPTPFDKNGRADKDSSLNWTPIVTPGVTPNCVWYVLNGPRLTGLMWDN